MEDPSGCIQLRPSRIIQAQIVNVMFTSSGRICHHSTLQASCQKREGPQDRGARSQPPPPALSPHWTWGHRTYPQRSSGPGVPIQGAGTADVLPGLGICAAHTWGQKNQVIKIANALLHKKHTNDSGSEVTVNDFIAFC